MNKRPQDAPVRPVAPKQAKSEPEADDGPVMPFTEALKRVWAAPPAHKVKAKSD